MVVISENKSSIIVPREERFSSSGMNFVQALNQKYVEQDILDDQYFMPRDKAISTGITLVGLGKVSNVQRQLYSLVNIDLSSKDIHSVGDIDSLGDCLRRVRVLNIANNSLDWRELVRLLPSLPLLQDLIVSSNRLNTTAELDHDIPCPPSKILQSLTIGKTYTGLRTMIDNISRVWSRVEQLDLWDCGLTDADMVHDAPDKLAISILQNLRCLSLSFNTFTNIDWIKRVNFMDNLAELDLSNCKLKTIYLDDASMNQLRNLQRLNVSYNDLDNWIDISRLFYLKKLKYLVCQENPFFINGKFSKSLTVARIGTIQNLNREEVTRVFRRDSETLYLRQLFPEYEDFKNGKDDSFHLRHPRFLELVDIYGLPDDPNAKQETEKYIQVNLCYSSQTIPKRLPRDMRIAQLRMLCKKLFRIPMLTRIRILCLDVNSDGDKLSYELDKDDQSLHFFSVRTCQTLMIEKIDV